MAQESAREMARRQRERAERLAQSAEAWERGADGEAATARALDALPPSEWTVFHDVRWPGRQRATSTTWQLVPAVSLSSMPRTGREAFESTTTRSDRTVANGRPRL